MPSTVRTKDLNVQLHEPTTLLHLPVDSASHLAKKLSILQVPRDGATGVHSIQSYMSDKALLAE